LAGRGGAADLRPEYIPRREAEHVPSNGYRRGRAPQTSDAGHGRRGRGAPAAAV